MNPIQILVVEDSKMFANVITNQIQARLGFDCIVTATLEETKTLVEKNPTGYFLAVLDLNLPDAHDEEIVNYIISKGIPSIVFTGNFGDDIRERILSKDVVDYVLKESTQDVDYLVRTIHRIYKNQAVKILVVDDSNVTRALLRNLLTIQKFTVLEACSGREGLDVLKQNPDIKLIITDYSMPEMDGFQFTSAVRRKYDADRLAIMGISAHGSGILSAKFLKKGANDFVNKPFAKEELYCRVNQNIEMLEYIEVIQDASNKDYLTGLYNRRYFFELGRKIFENVKRGNLNITIAMIDIDCFKKINDTYGHETGDAALKKVAKIISENFRKADIVSRFGGEEFCVLATNMKHETTFSIFDELRQLIEKEKVPITLASGNIDLSLSVSVGVNTRIYETLEEMINRADELLYKAKENGRNQVILD
ncbi:MAG: diguanylate cyclase [Candidatus Omnitrophota bacterium]